MPLARVSHAALAFSLVHGDGCESGLALIQSFDWLLAGVQGQIPETVLN